MAERVLDFSEILRIPPFSPEFNKVIEHAHARLEPEVKLGLSSNPGAWGFEAVSKIIDQAFYAVNDPTVIRKDVLSLPDTFAEVLKAEGGHIPKPYR
jgi:hypothetical protein